SGLPAFPNAYATLYDSGVDADTIPLLGAISYTIEHCRILLTATSNGTGTTSYHWDFGDGHSSTGQSVNHLYADTGTYTVQLQIHDARSCKEDSVLVQQQITIINKLHLQFTSTGTCAGQQVQFTNNTVDINNAVQNWHWQFGNGQSAQGRHAAHTYQQGGIYAVKLQAQLINGCSYSTTAPVTIEQPVAFAGNDTAAKTGSNLQLQGSGGAQYEWIPATNLSVPFIANPVAFVAGDISYVLKVTSATGCTDFDTVHIKAFDRYEVYVPDAFTPNGDGRNDRLRPLGFGIRELTYFRIYNRWGELVYTSSQMLPGWDGRIRGKMQAPDVYVWLLEAKD
ncbi:MAG: PKD domain-containing protein, partial [Sphingobacteriales bacterium]